MEFAVIEKKIQEIVIDYFELDNIEINPDDNIVQTLELNSLTRMELVVLIAKYFDVKIPLKDFTSIITFGDLYKYISASRNQE